MNRAPLPGIKACVFDAYGTLFDVYSVGLLAEQLFPGRGDALATLWRDKQIEYTRLASMSGRYRPFWDLTRAGLRFAALKLGLVLERADEDRLMNQYRHLSAFPENREVLAALKDRGIRAGILSPDDGVGGSVELAILGDTGLTERQKQSLLDVYASFLALNAADGADDATPAGADTDAGDPASITTEIDPDSDNRVTNEG